MFDRLGDVLSGREQNAIMPLFWQKGGPPDAVREEMQRIGDAGIGAVILEARPHPEFLGDGWWRDVDAVLEIARSRGMKVWFFDDDSFPTGHAAGRVPAAPSALHRRFLAERHTDVVGPARGASLIVERHKFWGPEAALDPGRLIRIVAFPRDEASAELVGEPVDLSDRVVDGRLYWDIPEGHWRVFFLSVVRDGGSARHATHINPLNPASTQVLIDTVHERIYQRYADDFGSTIAGFFTDEPGVYNDADTFDFTSALGKGRVALPWSDDLLEELTGRLDRDAALLLPLLWSTAQGAERPVRFAFMDAVTRLYERNFTRRLGDWCRAHGVEYIGHVVEDNGVHARLGPGAGHYFRAMAGQDMSGIDIIGGQVVPGFGHGPFANTSGAADGEFFHFGLAKLASSAAHIDPRKRGRAMCETIGAYGWYAGLRLFTWLTDHLLVNGVTHVVPHAFSPAEFPDPDCPPHFYARGNNPQYRYHHLLSAYTNRVSHLLSGGVHVAPFAVLYHAEAEWLGRAMPVDRPLRLLAEAQLDADVVPADALAGAAVVAGRLVVGSESYDALVVPAAAYLPPAAARTLVRLAEAGLPVVFVDEVPTVVDELPELLQKQFDAVPQRGLVRALSPLTTRAVRTTESVPGLRVYRVRHDDADVVMLFNESPFERARTELGIPRAGEVVRFDPFGPTCVAVPSSSADGVTTVPVDLAPGAAEILLCGPAAAFADAPVAQEPSGGEARALDLAWTLHTATAQEYPSFRPLADGVTELTPLDVPGLLPDFSGTVRYTATFPAEPSSEGGRLDLGEVHEIAQVRLNGVDLGTRIAPPYTFAVPDGVLDAENTLTVEVTNTLVKAQPDYFSAWAQQDPTGLLGPVTLTR